MFPLFGVLSAIDFNDDLHGMRREIDDVAA